MHALFILAGLERSISNHHDFMMRHNMSYTDALLDGTYGIVSHNRRFFILIPLLRTAGPLEGRP